MGQTEEGEGQPSPPTGAQKIENLDEDLKPSNAEWGRFKYALKCLADKGHPELQAEYKALTSDADRREKLFAWRVDPKMGVSTAKSVNDIGDSKRKEKKRGWVTEEELGGEKARATKVRSHSTQRVSRSASQRLASQRQP